MFVINNTKENLVFRAHGQVLVLEEGLNLVDNLIFNAVELKNHFGDLISITSEVCKEKEPELAEVELEGEIDIDEDELIGHPDFCKACYEDGKTPNQEDCIKCKEEQLKKELAEVKQEETKKEETKKEETKKEEAKTTKTVKENKTTKARSTRKSTKK